MKTRHGNQLVDVTAISWGKYSSFTAFPILLHFINMHNWNNNQDEKKTYKQKKWNRFFADAKSWIQILHIPFVHLSFFLSKQKKNFFFEEKMCIAWSIYIFLKKKKEKKIYFIFMCIYIINCTISFMPLIYNSFLLFFLSYS